jgi:hypothetical protein
MMMHPAFREMMLQENQRNLDRKLRHSYLLRERHVPAAPPAEPVMLRLSSVHDDEVLGRLAVLEGRRAPTGQHVVAEVRGVVVAALPLGPGSAIADPFRPTAHLIPLLELRAKQLAEDRPRWRSRPVWRAVRVWSRA